MDSDFVRNVLLVFAALFPIVNPVGMAPIFASMTFPYSSDVRRTMAMRIAINGIVLLVASIFIGSYILEFFGISIAAVQFGGGLVVTVSGWHILNSRSDVAERQSDAPSNSPRFSPRLSILSPCRSPSARARSPWPSLWAATATRRPTCS